MCRADVRGRGSGHVWQPILLCARGGRAPKSGGVSVTVGEKEKKERGEKRKRRICDDATEVIVCCSSNAFVVVKNDDDVDDGDTETV